MYIKKNQKNITNFIIEEQVIESFSEKANAHRNIRRNEVDALFNERDAKVFKEGKEYYKYNFKERERLDRQARNLWRIIIIESNKM